MPSGIYRIFSPSGGEYVGSAVDIEARWRVHRHLLNKGKHHSKALQRAAEKYGTHVLLFEVLKLCPIHALISEEQAFIDARRPRYNACLIAGSQLGRKHTPEAKEKNAAAHRGVSRHSEEARKALSARMLGNKYGLGRRHSAEQRAEISARNKGRTHKDSFASRATDQQKLEVVNLYVSGMGLPQLAAHFKACRRAVRKILTDNGIPIRGPNDHISKLGVP